MFDRLKQIFKYRNVLWNMAISQLKTKYSNSLIGIFWSILNPVLIMLAITFVFTVVFRTEIKNFAFFVLAGILPWMFFSGAISEVTNSILSQQNILRQFNLPKEIIPLSCVLANFVNFLIGWVIVYPIFFILNPKIILFFPLFILILLLNFIFMCGVSLIFSILNVFYRDLGHSLGVLLMFWFWVTPVFYSIDMVPLSLHWIFKINPLTFFVTFYREVIFSGVIPDLSVVTGVFTLALLSIGLGFLIFWRLEPKLIKAI